MIGRGSTAGRLARRPRSQQPRHGRLLGRLREGREVFRLVAVIALGAGPWGQHPREVLDADYPARTPPEIQGLGQPQQAPARRAPPPTSRTPPPRRAARPAFRSASAARAGLYPARQRPIPLRSLKPQASSGTNRPPASRFRRMLQNYLLNYTYRLHPCYFVIIE